MSGILRQPLVGTLTALSSWPFVSQNSMQQFWRLQKSVSDILETSFRQRALLLKFWCIDSKIQPIQTLRYLFADLGNKRSILIVNLYNFSWQFKWILNNIFVEFAHWHWNLTSMIFVSPVFLSKLSKLFSFRRLFSLLIHSIATMLTRKNRRTL